MHSMTTNDMPSLMEFSCAFAPMGGCPASRGCEPEPNIGTSLHTNSVCRRCRFIFTQRKWGFNHKITYGSFCLLLMRPFIWLSATKNCYNATVDLNWHPPPSYTVNGTKIKKDDSFSIWVVYDQPLLCWERNSVHNRESCYYLRSPPFQSMAQSTTCNAHQRATSTTLLIKYSSLQLRN